MAIENTNFVDVGAIAQALKFHIRSGKFWEELPPASKESLDQIATLIARIVSGDQPHWDAIVSYAQAARPSPPAPLELEREMRRLVREIPKPVPNSSDA